MSFIELCISSHEKSTNFAEINTSDKKLVQSKNRLKNCVCVHHSIFQGLIKLLCETLQFFHNKTIASGILHNESWDLIQTLIRSVIQSVKS